MSTEENGFLSRWSRRKTQARQETGDAPAAPWPLVAPAAPEAPGVAEAAEATPAPPESAAAQPLQRDHATAESGAQDLPTMADVALLGRDSDYSRFVAQGLDEKVKNAAMKKLFSDPHFNLMDGLDTYIDDYGKPDPIPLAMLRQMNQAVTLGLFADEDEDEDEDEQNSAKAQDLHNDEISDSRNESTNDKGSDSNSDDNNFGQDQNDREEQNKSGQEGKEAASPPPRLAQATPSGPHLNPHDDDADLQLQPDHAAGWPSPGQGAGP